MTSESRLEKTAIDLLTRLTDEGIFAVGGQLAVIVNGDTVVDIAVGQAGGGSKMTTDALHNVYCLCKPVPYLLLGHALEVNGFGPDEPLDETGELPTWAPKGLTYRELARHDAALAEPSAYVWRNTPPDERQELLDRTSNHLGPAYSEISGGVIVEHIIERLGGQPPNHYCAKQLLEPLGLSGEIIIDAESALAARSRIRVPVIGLPGDPLPMLTELLPAHIRETRLAIGAYATMRGMARLFAATGQAIGGAAQPGLPSPGLLGSLLDDDRPLRDDPILRRPAKWAAGLMTDVNQQGISKAAGPGSVGHTAGLANCVALYDPGRQASVALYLNGVGVENDDYIVPRQQLIDAVVNAIPIS